MIRCNTIIFKCIATLLGILYLSVISPEAIATGISFEDKIEERAEIISQENQFKVGHKPITYTSEKDPLHTISLLNEYSDNETISPKIRKHLWVSCLLI